MTKTISNSSRRLQTQENGDIRSRISDETKQRVKMETTIIEQRAKRVLMRSRKKIEKETEDRLKNITQSRLNQTREWKIKTVKNPLNMNQYEVELKRQTIATERRNRENFEKERNQLIDSLTGVLDTFHDICPPDKLKVFSIIDEKHAMEYRKTKLESKLLKYEKETLDKLLSTNIHNIKQENHRLTG